MSIGEGKANTKVIVWSFCRAHPKNGKVTKVISLSDIILSDEIIPPKNTIS
jgi:hypothetical protein